MPTTPHLTPPHTHTVPSQGCLFLTPLIFPLQKKQNDRWETSKVGASKEELGHIDEEIVDSVNLSQIKSQRQF